MKLPVKLTLHERILIRDQTFFDTDFARIAIVKGKGVKVELSLDEIEEIQGYVADEANTGVRLGLLAFEESKPRNDLFPVTAVRLTFRLTL